MRALRLSAALVVLLTPGCFTGGLWSWAHDEGVDYYKPVALEEVVPGPHGELSLRLRMADGSQRHERAWGATSPDGPDAAFAEARRAARFERHDEALAALERAVRRGLQRRGFAAEPDLAALADHPRLARLDATPPAPPRLALRDPAPSRPVVTTHEEAWVDVVHLAPPEPPEVLLQVQPISRTVDRGGPLGYVAAVLATPVTFALDVVTSPVQVVLIVWALDSLFGLLD